RARPTGIETNVRPDPTVFDGRFANNGWLQELPKPLTKLTWDNVALVSPATAEKLIGKTANETAGRYGGERGLGIAEIGELRLGHRSVRAPLWGPPRPPRGPRARPSRLRPRAGGPRRHRRRLQRLPPAHRRRPVDCRSVGGRARPRAHGTGLHPGALHDGGPRPRPPRHEGAVRR